MCSKIQVLNCAIPEGQRAVVNGCIVVHSPVSSESGCEILNTVPKGSLGRLRRGKTPGKNKLDICFQWCY